MGKPLINADLDGNRDGHEDDSFGAPSILIKDAIEIQMCANCGMLRMLNDTCPHCGNKSYWIYHIIAKFIREVRG